VLKIKEKMSKAIYKFLLTLAFIALAHSAYSAAQCKFNSTPENFKNIFYYIYFVDRTYLRISEQEFSSLPIDISFQAITSFVVIIYSILALKSDFKVIQAAEIGKSNWDGLSNIQSFYTFNHRGKALFNPQYQQPNLDLLN
jgi:hypothetical protein